MGGIPTIPKYWVYDWVANIMLAFLTSSFFDLRNIPCI
jgi:hypothetical protein